MKTVKLLTYLMIISFLVGCSKVKMPLIAKYTIMNAQQQASGHGGKTKLTLLVNAPDANPGYESSKMIYVLTPQELESFSKNKWVAPPSKMMLPILVNAIRNRHYFHAVASSPFAALTNYRLDTKILVLQQEFLQPISEVRLIMQGTLIDNTTDHVVASRVFGVILPTNENNPYCGVLATTEAANRIAKQIARFATRNAK